MGMSYRLAYKFLENYYKEEILPDENLSSNFKKHFLSVLKDFHYCIEKTEKMEKIEQIKDLLKGFLSEI